MAVDLTTIQEFTDAEMLKLYRNAMAKIALGQSYTIGNRTLTNADAQFVRDSIGWLEKRIGDASGGDATTAYVEFNQP